MNDFALFYERYTSSKDEQSLYASLLVWSKNITEITYAERISSSNTRVTLFGSNTGPLSWRSAGARGVIIIDISNVKIYSLANDWT